MKMKASEYVELTNEFAGYCTACDDVTEHGGVEPDAERYECPDCGKRTLMGIEQAMLLGRIEIVAWDQPEQRVYAEPPRQDDPFDGKGDPIDIGGEK
jgi:predicted RNA-binding Zn-ribbon protein involved in translation (DUF1610 family)